MYTFNIYNKAEISYHLNISSSDKLLSSPDKYIRIIELEAIT
jgi:hypothetical protein